MLKIAYSNKFKKDYNKVKRKLSFEDRALFFEIIRKLKIGEELDTKFVDHKLNDS